MDYTNRALAEKAWIRHKHRYIGLQYLREFKDGFIDGYIDVATGGTGCTPDLAPRKYWGWSYQTPHGHAAVGAYFRGFPIGAKAADEDGVGHWRQIQTSGANQSVIPMAMLYGDQSMGSFNFPESNVPVPEVIEPGVEIEIEPETPRVESVDPLEIPAPDPPVTQAPVIESPSDETDFVSEQLVDDAEAIKAVILGDEAEAFNPADDPSVFESVIPIVPATNGSNELPFSFE